MKDLVQATELEKFLLRLNAEPKPNEIFKTPDGKASDLPISYVEMTLDELYFGMWNVRNFKAQLISNEVVGELELEVLHPVTGTWITRAGAACIQIMVDAVPDSIKDDRQQKNRWALNPDNKKSNALDMAYPKLKAECIKNAAKTLGKVFGRDLNRKEKVDTYKPVIHGSEKSKMKTVERALELGNLEQAKNLMALFPDLSPETKDVLTQKIENAKTALVAA